MVGIKEMKMPNSCSECNLTTRKTWNYACSINLKDIDCTETKRPKDCPLVEVDTCDDAISRKSMLDYLKYLHGEMQEEEFVKALPSVTPNKDEWVPISERLPEERIAVLVWCPERKNIYCACYEEKQWWIFGAYFKKIEDDVTAWQSLPEPYEEK